jgi:chromosome segregation ATPase
VLDAKIRELRREVEPREQEIDALRAQIEAVEKELQQYHASNKMLDGKIGAVRAEIEELGDAAKRCAREEVELAKKLKAFETDLYLGVQTIIKGGAKAAVGAAAALAAAHGAAESADGTMMNRAIRTAVTSALDMGVIAESVRQQEHLTATVKTLRGQLNALSKGGGPRASLAEALVAENTALITQARSLRDAEAKMRADAAALLLQARVSQRMGGGSSTAGSGAARVRAAREEGEEKKSG